MYKGFLIDKSLIGKDIHFEESCTSCHKGNEKGPTRAAAHKGLVAQPSKNLGHAKHVTRILQNRSEPRSIILLKVRGMAFRAGSRRKNSISLTRRSLKNHAGAVMPPAATVT